CIEPRLFASRAQAEVAGAQPVFPCDRTGGYCAQTIPDRTQADSACARRPPASRASRNRLRATGNGLRATVPASRASRIRLRATGNGLRADRFWRSPGFRGLRPAPSWLGHAPAVWTRTRGSGARGPGPRPRPDGYLVSRQRATAGPWRVHQGAASTFFLSMEVRGLAPGAMKQAGGGRAKIGRAHV